MDGQGTKCFRNISEHFNRLSRAHERYRRQTDGRGHSERELFGLSTVKFMGLGLFVFIIS